MAVEREDLRDWHRLFGLLLTDFFTSSPFRVDVERDLSVQRQLLDVVIVPKTVPQPARQARLAAGPRAVRRATARRPRRATAAPGAAANRPPFSLSVIRGILLPVTYYRRRNGHVSQS
jgi:hypothetical protein